MSVTYVCLLRPSFSSPAHSSSHSSCGGMGEISALLQLLWSHGGACLSHQQILSCKSRLLTELY